MSFPSPVWCCGNQSAMAQRVRFACAAPSILICPYLSFPSWIHCCLRGRWTRSRCCAGLGTPLEFPEDQTRSGRPAFNTGYSNEAVPGAEHFVQVFKDADMVVWHSGWCATMVRKDDPELLAASSLRKLARRSFGAPAAPPISRRFWCRARRDRDGYSSSGRPEPSPSLPPSVS
jgi:hypothetical protein